MDILVATMFFLLLFVCLFHTSTCAHDQRKVEKKHSSNREWADYLEIISRERDREGVFHHDMKRTIKFVMERILEGKKISEIQAVLQAERPLYWIDGNLKKNFVIYGSGIGRYEAKIETREGKCRLKVEMYDAKGQKVDVGVHGSKSGGNTSSHPQRNDEWDDYWKIISRVTVPEKVFTKDMKSTINLVMARILEGKSMGEIQNFLADKRPLYWIDGDLKKNFIIYGVPDDMYVAKIKTRREDGKCRLRVEMYNAQGYKVYDDNDHGSESGGNTVSHHHVPESGGKAVSHRHVSGSGGNTASHHHVLKSDGNHPRTPQFFDNSSRSLREANSSSSNLPKPISTSSKKGRDPTNSGRPEEATVDPGIRKSSNPLGPIHPQREPNFPGSSPTAYSHASNAPADKGSGNRNKPIIAGQLRHRAGYSSGL